MYRLGSMIPSGNMSPEFATRTFFDATTDSNYRRNMDILDVFMVNIFSRV